MVEWSIKAFRASPSVRSIVVAVPPGLPRDELKLGGEGVEVVDGGATRAQSVSHALEVVDTELVAIHDAARPLVTPELIEETIAALEADPDAAGAIAATPVTDTIKRVRQPLADSGQSSAPFPTYIGGNGALIEKTLDRGRLWGAQTPQVFRAAALREALAADPEENGAATDEAMLIEAAGGRVLIHPSSSENLKVTTPLDLKVAELLLSGAPGADD